MKSKIIAKLTAPKPLKIKERKNKIIFKVEPEEQAITIVSAKQKELMDSKLTGCIVYCCKSSKYVKNPEGIVPRFRILEQNESGVSIISRNIGYAELSNDWHVVKSGLKVN